ncbi:MAG: hypothetical protein H7Y20_18240, partial [Bryobacteraceae bacterium]|nr:hypothetical protein [Bryobacteraceae bacterium]
MKLTLTLVVFTAILPLGAQDKSLTCDDRKSWNDNGRQQRSCEMREFPIAAVPRMIVDGRTNGGISVKGANRSDILVRARIETWAPTSGEARSIAGQINIQTAGGNVHADAPDFGSERGWSVSYEIFVPQRTDLSLKAHNGGIKIADTTGG